MAFLDERHISYQIPDEFYRPEEINRICEKKHDEVAELCALLDDKFHRHYPDLDIQAIQPFSFHIVPLTILFDSACSHIFKLGRIFRAHEKGHVVLARTANQQWGEYDLCFSYKQALWGDLAALSNWNRNVELLNVERETEQTSKTLRDSAMSRLRREVLRSVRLTTLFRLWDGSKSLFGSLKAGIKSKPPAFLVLDSPGEWKYILPHLERNGHRLIFAYFDYFRSDPGDSLRSTQSFADELESDRGVKKYFQQDGLCFFPLMKDRLAWIAAWAHNLKSVRRKLVDLRNRYGIEVLLTSSSPTGTCHAVHHLARGLGMKVLLWQHGLVAYDDRVSQMRDYSDLMTTDATYVYGTGAYEAYTTHGNRTFDSKVIPVGAVSLDKLRSTRRERPKHIPGESVVRILYATTNYYQNAWYFGMRPGFSDTLLYRDQWTIINGLLCKTAKTPVALTLKLHPGDLPYDPPGLSRLQGLKNVTIIKRERTFEELLASVDAVVLDCPSTTLLKVLAAGLPVFVLTRYWRFSDEACALLRRAAVLSDTAEELIQTVHGWLGSGIYQANPDDTGFLEAYGTYSSDGRSLDRAIIYLKQ